MTNFSLKVGEAEPFGSCTMSPVSSSADVSTVSGQFALAVDKKINDNAADEGQAELSLIQASAPQKATSGSVGTQLHVVA